MDRAQRDRGDQMATDKKYNINLAILRVVAMVMVISIHVGNSTNWTKYVQKGSYGVRLFFILSGYLIYASLDSGISIKEFYKKRVLRILPEYWAALILYWLLGVGKMSLHGDFWKAVGSYHSPWGIRYLRYFTFTNSLLISDNDALWNNRNAWWTMSSFMVFYLLAPFIYKLIHRFFSAEVVLFALMYFTPRLRLLFENLLRTGFSSEKYNIDAFRERFPFFQLYCFFFGIALYLAVREGRQFLYLLCILFWTCVLDSYQFESTLALCVLGSLHCEIKLGERMKSAVLFLSEGSFSVYCIHAGIVGTVATALQGVRMYAAVRFALLFLVTCVICYTYYGVYRSVRGRIRRRNRVG